MTAHPDAPVAVEEQRLYKSREKIFPKSVSGFYRRFKWRLLVVTLAIYYLTPWIRWDRGPYAPDQAVLVDLANRRFYFFFIEIWPQEFYYVAGLLIMAGFGLFLVTSVWGRAWCGYFCPQTVWTDLFMHVERWIEGDRNAQIRLEKAPWTADKVRKRVSKHAVWLVIAVLTGGAWVFYFADAPTLAVELARGEAASAAYAAIGVLTFTTYSLGGLMREQVCIYMCPWPRIQGAMTDANTLTVTYHDWRGEPRARHRKQAAAQGRAVGDCVDCNACVAVCPVGIDIRDGQQFECITCGLCIDACDNVMEKVGLPPKLISYATLRDHEAAAEGRPPQPVPLWRRAIRPRTVVYFLLWAGIGLAMLAALAGRDRLDLNVQKDRNPVFVTLSDGAIRNGYTVKALNMAAEPRAFRLSIDGLRGATLELVGAAGADASEVEVGPDRVRSVRAFVTAPPDAASGEVRFTIEEIGATAPETDTVAAPFAAPEED